MQEPVVTNVEIEGARLAVRLAGDREKPTLVLLHGFPSSSESFRNVIGTLARDCFVVAPDLPGFGSSEPVARPSFARFADLIGELLRQLGALSFHLYLHDFGAAVGLHLATRTPHAIRSLIIQNANAHESGMGPQWAATRAYWDDPTPEREAEATAHLNFEGTRDQYVGGVPRDVAERIDASAWEADFRILSLPGRLETQRALVLDYRSHVVRFGEIAEYLQRWQPPALMLWGRHDVFFDLAETLCWMRALPRMEAHILDGPHFLLETHAAQCAALMSAFVRRVEGLPPDDATPRAGTLQLRERDGRIEHRLLDRVVHGGDLLELCCSGGWLIGRYEWGGGEAAPRFHFSVELMGGGRVWESSFELPESALLRWRR